MTQDRFFGGPTALSPAVPLVVTNAPHPAASKAIQVHKIGQRLWKLIAGSDFRLPRPAPNKPFETLSPREQGTLLFLLLSADTKLLQTLDRGDPEIAQSIRDFQQLVPLVPNSKVLLLHTTPDVQLKALKQAYRLFEAGKLVVAEMVDAAKTITGLELAGDAAIKAYIQGHTVETPTAAHWVFYGVGSESKAYQDGTGLVYKVAPIAQAMLDIPPITNGGPLYPRVGAHLFSNALGQIPIFERGLAAATFPGLAPIEIVALTEGGNVVFKQVDFGETEPTADELLNWALQHGHVPLPSQGEDPKKEFDNDTSVIPVVVKEGTQFHLILDLNARNCRVVHSTNGKRTIVPFDVISRPLLADEIKIHPQLQAAVARLKRRPDVSV